MTGDDLTPVPADWCYRCAWPLDRCVRPYPHDPDRTFHLFSPHPQPAGSLAHQAVGAAIESLGLQDDVMEGGAPWKGQAGWAEVFDRVAYRFALMAKTARDQG